jgi:2-C-methyl-D-erythritol 4-phosphate cytidylyltransferase
MTPLSVILPAAGASSRLGFDKLLTPIGAATLLERTLRAISKSPLVEEIIVVAATETRARVQEIVTSLQITQPIRVVPGGAERQDSVFAGLQAADPRFSYLMIHDAARPLVTPELIALVAQAAITHGAAVCGHPMVDTIKVASADGTIVSTPDRDTMWAVQTPQIFRRDWILPAYEKLIASGKKVTDDTAAVTELGHPVHLVRHDALNLKVTRPGDWDLANQLLGTAEEDLKTANEFRRLIHDISNQVTSVLGFTFLLEMDMPEDSPMRDHVTALNDSSQKCHHIIGLMQQLAREFHVRKMQAAGEDQAMKH